MLRQLMNSMVPAAKPSTVVSASPSL